MEQRESIRNQSLKRLSCRGILAGILKRPVQVILAVTAITLFFASYIPQLSFKTSIYDLVIEDLPETDRYGMFKELFGSEEIIRVVIKSKNVFDPAAFKKIKEISDALSKINGARRVISLPGIKKAIDIGDKWKLAEFESIISPVQLFKKNLISADRKTTAISLVLKNEADKESVIQAVEEIISASAGEISLYQIGMPLVSQALAVFSQKDFSRLPLITFAIIAFVLLCLFRNVSGLILPLVSVLFSLIWTLGFMALTRIPLSMVTVIVPVFLIAVGTAYCLHIITDYLFHAQKAESPADAAFLTFTSITFPTTLAVLTTVVGLGSLLVNRIPAIREFAIFSCFGILSLLTIVLTFFPAALALLPLPKKKNGVNDGLATLLDWFLSWIVRVDLNHQKIALPILGIVVLVCLIGIFKIRVETNPVGFFREDIPVSRNFHDIYKDLSGSFPVNVVMQSKEDDFFEKPESVAAVARLQQYLETLPGVDKTISFADYMRLVNYASNQFQAEYYALPDEDFEVRML
ncbi:MAG: MMPL family transporter, partial [bacterium]|nr:MMPL family transporter [bacterium]